MAPTTRTCRLALAAALASAAAPALGSIPAVRSSAGTFVAARAAATAGDARRAALLYASLAAADPSNRIVASRAIGQAILAGDSDLALRLIRAAPTADLAPDARLLWVADELRSGRQGAALANGWPQELAFVAPFARAWTLAERRKWGAALAELDGVKPDNLLAPAVPEQKALILLAAGKSKDAQLFIPVALHRAGGRANRLRIAFAAGLIRDGQREAGLALLEGRDVTVARAAASLAGQRRPELSIRTAAQGLGEVLTGLAAALSQGEQSALPLALAQVARHADPSSEQGAILLSLLLERGGRTDEALALLRTLPAGSPFASSAHDAEVRALLRGEQRAAALARAQAFVAEPRATADDWSRLGDVFDTLDRQGDAAGAYGKAAALVDAGGPGPDPWSVHLLRGAALEKAGRWPEARQALQTAHKLAPDNPIVLNYLGYARLERGEDLGPAEAMIAEAHRRAPDDASIIDSLGWAQFKNGKLHEAIATLQRAAAAGPGDPEINEHLGDALYASGRRFEARFAWQAALVTAEDKVRTRIEGKLVNGLPAASPAP